PHPLQAAVVSRSIRKPTGGVSARSAARLLYGPLIRGVPSRSRRACATSSTMTRRLLFLLSVVSLPILSSCGGGSSPAPTPISTPPVVKGVLAASVLSAYGTREGNGVKLHVQVR